MKILYIAPVDPKSDKFLGVINKINGQANALNELGNSVDQLRYGITKLYFNETLLTKYSKGIYRRLFMFGDVKRLVDIGKYDLIYIRYDTSDLFFVSFLKSLNKKKVIIELPTYPYDMERIGENMLNKISILLDKLYRQKLKKYVDYIVTFTKFDYIWGIPVIVLENAIDINNIEFTRFEHVNNTINLIGVANVSKWHGYDRVIEGLYNYYSQDFFQEVIFHIVGSGDEIENLRKLVELKSLNQKVIFHGSKVGNDLTNIFKYANIAVGSLGMHRIGLIEGSTLKAKEYAARGIPFVLGYEDKSFTNKEYVLNVENNETAIDIKVLLEFYYNLKIDGKSMREEAEKYFTWKHQMSNLLNILENR